MNFASGDLAVFVAFGLISVVEDVRDLLADGKNDFALPFDFLALLPSVLTADGRVRGVH